MCRTQTPIASSSSSSLGARPELLAPQRTLAARTGGRQCVIASISSSSITTKEDQPATYREPSASATKLRAVGRIMESTLLEHACLFGQTSSLTNTRDPELRDREIRLHEHHRERVVAARALQTAPWLFPPTDDYCPRCGRIPAQTDMQLGRPWRDVNRCERCWHIPDAPCTCESLSGFCHLHGSAPAASGTCWAGAHATAVTDLFRLWRDWGWILIEPVMAEPAPHSPTWTQRRARARSLYGLSTIMTQTAAERQAGALRHLTPPPAKGKGKGGGKGRASSPDHYVAGNRGRGFGRGRSQK